MTAIRVLRKRLKIASLAAGKTGALPITYHTLHEKVALPSTNTRKFSIDQGFHHRGNMRKENRVDNRSKFPKARHDPTTCRCASAVKGASAAPPSWPE